MLKKYMLWSLALVLLSWSCEDDRDLTTLSLGAAPVIEAPATGTSYDITEETLGEDMATFSWTEADFGYQAAMTYTLEMAEAGTDFAEPRTIATALTTTSYTLTNDKINQTLLGAGFIGGIPHDIDFRVMAKVSDKVDALTSAPVTLTINPVPVVINYPLLTVPGAYQGWNVEDSTTVVWSVEQNDSYEGYVYFGEAGSEYKFARSSWDADKNWGDAEGDGVLEPDGGNIIQADMGLHRLTVDLDGLTYTSTKTDWGLIGDATPGGWDNDTPMTYDPETRLLTATLDLMASGKMKFRANGGWDINLGDDDPEVPGLQYGGADIAVPEDGNYTVTLDLTQAVYTFELTKN